jgi:hypothetical protein
MCKNDIRSTLHSLYASMLKPATTKPTPQLDDNPSANLLRALQLCPTCEAPANAAAECEHADCPFAAGE